MPSQLDFIQSLSERELCELVIIPLLEEMRYVEIRYTHGPRESGKDIMFCKPDPLAGQVHYCAVVKCHKLTGSVDSNQSVRATYFQISQALKQPFANRSDATPINVARAYVITPFEISQTAVDSIIGELSDLKNRISFIDGPRLLALLDQYCPTLLTSLPDPTIRYLHSLSRRILSSIRLTELGASTPLTLAEIYTGGALSPTTVDEARVISFARPDFGDNKVKAMEALSDTPHSVVLADVGAGKTTLLNKIALDIIEAETNAGTGNLRTIPLFVPLHTIPEAALRHFSSFSSALEDYVQQTEGMLDFSLSRCDNFILLLDGFDELRSEHEAVSSHVSMLSARFPKGLVLTSRPSRIPTKLSKFAFYKLNPFTDENIKDFLSKWFPRQEEFRQRVFEKISQDKTVHAFCRNPLFLTLYSILASRSSLDNLPTRRTDIYARICDLLLGEWDMSKAVKNEFSPNIKYALLQTLAFETHGNQEKQFSRYALDHLIAKMFVSLGTRIKPSQMTVHTEMLADELIFRSSLIKESVDKSRSFSAFEFAHLSFQEFLCAKYLMRATDARTVQQNLFDEWWRNTFVFYFGLKETMDGVLIPTDKAVERNGIFLMEFLSEATFTSIETKKRVFHIMGNDLLRSMSVSESELETCAQAGDPFLEALRTTVVDDAFKGITFNYLKLLALAGTPKARMIMQQDKKIFSKLNDRELMIILCQTSSFLRYDGWASSLREILDYLKRSGRVARSESDWDKEEYIQTFRTELKNAVGRGFLAKREAEGLNQVLKVVLR